MTNEFLHFEKISRQTWQSLHRKTTPPLTEEELESIKSFNDQISLQDVTDIYLPLSHLIQIYKRTKEDLAFSKGIFLQRESKSQPFIIGVSGSVAVGKSTTSRLLQILLSRTVTDATVELVTTDGFLYPNQTLMDQDILNRKGFPESYDMETLLNFLDRLKNGQDVDIPVYSHEVYDIVPGEKQRVKAADFVIVEGINVKCRLEKLKPLHIRFGPALISQIYKTILNQQGIGPRLFSTRLKTMKSMKFT